MGEKVFLACDETEYILGERPRTLWYAVQIQGIWHGILVRIPNMFSLNNVIPLVILSSKEDSFIYFSNGVPHAMNQSHTVEKYIYI